jgi:hypothetical protein
MRCPRLRGLGAAAGGASDEPTPTSLFVEFVLVAVLCVVSKLHDQWADFSHQKGKEDRSTNRPVRHARGKNKGRAQGHADGANRRACLPAAVASRSLASSPPCVARLPPYRHAVHDRLMSPVRSAAAG